MKSLRRFLKQAFTQYIRLQQLKAELYVKDFNHTYRNI